jgi:putative transcriptional regulator
VIGQVRAAKAPARTIPGYALQSILLFYASPRTVENDPLPPLHLMGRDKLRIADVSRRTGLNRSTITALYKETTTRVDLPAIEQLCRLFNCQVGDLFEYVQDGREVNP